MILSLMAVAMSVSGFQYVHMERGNHELREDFIQRSEANPEAYHEVVFAVKQKNTDALEKLFFEVSDPTSSKYGKFLTRKQVGDLTANPAATEGVKKFLMDNGATIVKTAPYGEYITAVAPVKTWNKLFATTFYEFEHESGSSKKKVTRAPHYSVPQDVAAHIEGVFNTVQLPMRSEVRVPLMQANATAGSGTVTPAFLNSYYHITTNKGSSLASQAVYESLEQYYSPADFATFNKQYNIPAQPEPTDIGGYVSDSVCQSDANSCAEANLDVQYLIAVAQNTPTTYWYDGSNDAFLSWIKDVSATEKPPLVNSISYGAIEPEIPALTANQFNTEAQKLGVQGVSILVSSGDDGVANFQARKNAKKCGYNPSFPASSPYVTAVGATQGPESNKPEIACTSDAGGSITTGGGFSTVFTAPSYQKSAVSNYFNGLTAAQKPATGYVATGRGYPDVAMAGFNYEVVIGGKTYKLSGTSASSPVVAGIVSLVNSARLAAGKSPLGFLNTAIYQNGGIFNDVTQGENNCAASKICCTQGFYATAGWDPLTGFGSVDYKKFYDVFYKL